MPNLYIDSLDKAVYIITKYSNENLKTLLENSGNLEFLKEILEKAESLPKDKMELILEFLQRKK
ncbi:hypothetical protein EPJ79_02695 [Brachyspira aalborgi]|uniref:Uncharacterized protein n=1 Tax=Brachyspira aalborgi TaxID=29522 RepID=A0A5C8D501_9SPIR|nr:hypothetical protein [Brachyspira aalborgi]TXJ20083.1 hypothetical protein EPJ79_02695 [Brachyspira aalborgi]